MSGNVKVGPSSTRSSRVTPLSSMGIKSQIEDGILKTTQVF